MSNTKLIGGRTVRWNDERTAEAYARGWWVRETLADSLADAAHRTPQRVVLIDGDYRLDCLSLHDQATALAQVLLERMTIGSVVSFMLPNWHEAAVIYLGATIAGMVVNPILPSLRESELLFILRDADTRMIFVPSVFGRHDYAAMLTRVVARMENPPEVIVVRDGPSLPEAKSPEAELPTLDPDAVRMVLYTSGTSGSPKGVLHSHNSMHALITQLRDHWQVQPGDRFLVPSPIAHIGGSIYAFECPLLLGTSAVLMDRWNADTAVELIDGSGCTHIAGATPFLEQLLAAAERAGTRLPELKLFVCGGASVPPSLIRRAAHYFERAAVTRVYGSTEVPVTTVGAPLDPDHAADTDGRPGFATIGLRGAGGEIHARGPQMLVGYLQGDCESFDSEGYFRTGDLGRWVDGEYLVVTGRAKDLIIRNGENIAPKEIEDILIGHPGVADIAIVGLPDARTGERACAVIVPTDEAQPDVASLRDFLQSRGVAIFKAPEQVAIWEALPRNDAGKVLKHQIQAALTATDG